jgi:hypothetical protein
MNMPYLLTLSVAQRGIVRALCRDTEVTIVRCAG